ncbi:MAG: AzlD domain-containing protein [Actinomycetota bacterium]
MKAWVVFVVGGLGTYLMRLSFFALGSRLSLPGWSRRSLKYVAPAVFAAIVLPPILGDDGIGGAATVNPRLIAAAVAGIIGYRTRSIGSVLIVGMLALWALQLAGL